MIDKLLALLTALKDWSNLLLVLVGFSAFVVYYWQKRDEKRAAATLVKGQIDLIEKRVCSLKEDHQLSTVSVYHCKVILQENLWEKYKHILIKSLQKSDVEIIQKFFDSAEQVETARSDIAKIIRIYWESRARVEVEMVGESIKNYPNMGQILPSPLPSVQQFQQYYQPIEIGYIPNIVINALVKEINDIGTLSGTTAYQKIQRLSYDKR